MLVTNIKELAKLIELLRKSGVEQMKLGELEIKLGYLPEAQSTKARASINQNLVNNPIVNEDSRIDSDHLTEEQLLYYSAIGQGAN